MPDKWQTPGGAVEDGETFAQAGIREIREEVGVEIAPHDLQFVGLVDLRGGSSDDTDIAIFTATAWTGEPRNMEPEKCSELRWVTASELPGNIITHSVPAIQNIDRAPLYIVSRGDEVVA